MLSSCTALSNNELCQLAMLGNGPHYIGVLIDDFLDLMAEHDRPYNVCLENVFRTSTPFWKKTIYLSKTPQFLARDKSTAHLSISCIK